MVDHKDGTDEAAFVFSKLEASNITDCNHSSGTGGPPHEESRVTNIHPAPTYPAQLTLLGVPLEIRHIIFSYLLLFDALLEHEGSEDYIPFHFEILWTCRQTRQEAWHYLVTSHRWVQIGIYSKEDREIQEPLLEMKERISPNRFPADMIRDLLQHQLMTIRIGFGCGRKKLPQNAVLAQRLIVPYNMWMWFILCSTLRDRVDYFNNFSFDLGSRYQDDVTGSSLPYDILLPLSVIRRANRVRFTQLMNFPLFDTMANAMTRTQHRPEDLHELVLGMNETGDEYIGLKDPITAHLW